MKKVAMADRDAGVSPARLSVLAVLTFGGPRNIGGLSVIERVKPPTMTNLLKGMEAEGFVRRERVGEDARQSRIAVTKKG
ncbi:MarR family transcriptional regulator, partial [Streptomyces brasiliscabiei]